MLSEGRPGLDDVYSVKDGTQQSFLPLGAHLAL